MFCIFEKLASTYMKSDDVSTLYISQARQLESQAKFKEAERLVHSSVQKMVLISYLSYFILAKYSRVMVIYMYMH